MLFIPRSAMHPAAVFCVRFSLRAPESAASPSRAGILLLAPIFVFLSRFFGQAQFFVSFFWFVPGARFAGLVSGPRLVFPTHAQPNWFSPARGKLCC
jgi:hypothetical protein